jgi:tRNA threonylcarbamoyl adenosine modification protein (Sua5/YciO/YrdC/YwlC family)
MGNIWALNADHPQPRKIRKLVEELEDGGIIAYPTDTVYGFGCDLHNRKAIDRVYRLKKVDKKHLMSFVCPDLSVISRYAQVSDVAYRVLKRLLPGPYTVILRATSMVPRVLLQKRKTVGIRVPDSPIAHALVEELGHPILSSSVTDSEGNPMLDPAEIRDTFKDALAAVVDGGFLGTEPSTVISLVEDEIEVIREGKGSLDIIGL